MPSTLHSDAYAILRKILIDARTSASLTQAQLAARLSRPQSYVSKYERGERRLDIIDFIELTAALDVDPASVIRDLQRTLGSSRLRKR